MDSDNNLFTAARESEAQGRFDLAAEHYADAISKGVGDQATAYARLGRALARLDQLEDAAAACKQALELEPGLHLAHSVMGYIYLRQAELTLAEKELLAAVRLKPDDATTLRNLTLVYTALGHHDKASAFCRDAIRAQPENVDLRLHSIRLHLAQSRFREALSELNGVRAMKPRRLLLYVYYVDAIIGAVPYWFKSLHPLAQLGASFGVALFVLLAPVSLLTVVGVAMSAYLLLLLLIGLVTRAYKQRGSASAILAFLFLTFLCLGYWIFVAIRSTA